MVWEDLKFYRHTELGTHKPGGFFTFPEGWKGTQGFPVSPGALSSLTSRYLLAPAAYDS